MRCHAKGAASTATSTTFKKWKAADAGMKKLIIIILVLLVIGLYFYTAQTKEFIQKTGNVAKRMTTTATDALKDSNDAPAKEPQSKSTQEKSWKDALRRLIPD